MATADRQTRFFDKDFLVRVALGELPKYSIVSKFGRNDSVGTTIVPVSINGDYQTPEALTSLRIVSSDANDNITGTGARKGWQ